MKRLYIVCGSVLLLGACVAMPYDMDGTIYADYPATVNAQASSSYYYDTHRVHPHAYSYPAPHYSRPYPYQPYPYYQAPTYTPSAPIIVPPTMEFHYKRHAQPGWQHRPHPQHDRFRNGPQPKWHHPGTPHSDWEHRHDKRPDWHQRDWGRKDWGQRDHGPNHWHRDRSYRR